MHSREYVRPVAEPPRIRLHRVSPTQAPSDFLNLAKLMPEMVGSKFAYESVKLYFLVLLCGRTVSKVPTFKS